MGLTLEAGAVLGERYRLDRRLGQGGMGVVWAATDTAKARLVALKVLTPTADPAKQRDLQLRLRREARAAGAVQHPSVCAILDVLELDDGSPALVMEHLQGETLAGLLAREPVLDLAGFARIFVPVLAGVAAVHAHGIVHRDLKPENIFLVEGPPRAVKVLDFGIAKLTVSEAEVAASTLQTATGAVLGTPCYMSPEQFGERDIDLRADVWSLGLIAYRCLSGVLPTQGDHLFDIFRKIVDRPVPPLETAAPGLPAEVTGLVGRMLARKRDDRPRDLREAMEVFTRHAGAPAAIDPMATTYDAVLHEAGLPGTPPLPRPEAHAEQPPAPLPGSSVDGGWPRRGVVRTAIVAAALGGLWLALPPRAPGAPTSPAAPSAGPSASPSAAAPANGAAPLPEPTVPAQVTQVTPTRASPPRVVPTQHSVRPPAAEPASASPAQPTPSAAPPAPKGGLVKEPPF